MTRDAPAAESVAPKPLARGEVERRRSALAARIPPERRASLETSAWRFDVDRAGGAWALVDKATGVVWTSDPARSRFGEVVLQNRQADRSAVWRIDRFDDVAATPES